MGKYPDANCVLVSGTEERVLLDTTPGLVARGVGAVAPIDRILVSHAHEDHTAGNFLFPEAEVHVHRADLAGLVSLEGMLDLFGPPSEGRAALGKKLVDVFNFSPRPDAIPFEDGDIFELGGGSRVEVLHTPGHTRGHCSFWIQPADILFLADVDLTGFGPFYADAWGSLEDFEATLRKLRPLEARYYLSGHHVGLLSGRRAFLERLDRYEAKLADREQRLLTYLDEPHTIEEIAAHRFIYRPQDPGSDHVERRSMSQHIDRLIALGSIEEPEPGLFRAASGLV